MALGDEFESPAQRMEYKGGTWPDREVAQGGMNEMALAAFFEEKLAEYMADNVEFRGGGKRSLPESPGTHS